MRYSKNEAKKGFFGRISTRALTSRPRLLHALLVSEVSGLVTVTAAGRLTDCNNSLVTRHVTPRDTAASILYLVTLLLSWLRWRRSRAGEVPRLST